VYTCIFVRLCIYIVICIHTCILIHVYHTAGLTGNLSVHIYKCTFVYICNSVHLHIYIDTRLSRGRSDGQFQMCIHVNIRLCTCVIVYIHPHILTHVCHVAGLTGNLKSGGILSLSLSLSLLRFCALSLSLSRAHALSLGWCATGNIKSGGVLSLSRFPPLFLSLFCFGCVMLYV